MKITQDLEKRIKNIEAKLGISNFEPETIYFQGFEYKTVKSKTGRVWLDRNIGASRVAESLYDPWGYGEYFPNNGDILPDGFRLPTEKEWEEEIATWESKDSHGAFASPLKLPMAGYRSYRDDLLRSVDTFGLYWSSTVSGSDARRLYFDSSNAGMGSTNRAFGIAVRLIKNT